MAPLLILLILLSGVLAAVLFKKDQEVEELKAKQQFQVELIQTLTKYGENADLAINDLEKKNQSLKVDLRTSLNAGDCAVRIAEKHKTARERLLGKLKDSRVFGAQALDALTDLDALIEKERGEQSNKESILQQQKQNLEEALAKTKSDLKTARGEIAQAKDQANSMQERYSNLKDKYQTLRNKVKQLISLD